MSEFMRAAEVAELLGVTERRVYQMMADGQLDYDHLIAAQFHGFYEFCS